MLNACVNFFQKVQILFPILNIIEQKKKFAIGDKFTLAFVHSNIDTHLKNNTGLYNMHTNLKENIIFL